LLNTVIYILYSKIEDNNANREDCDIECGLIITRETYIYIYKKREMVSSKIYTCL